MKMSISPVGLHVSKGEDGFPMLDMHCGNSHFECSPAIPFAYKGDRSIIDWTRPDQEEATSSSDRFDDTSTIATLEAGKKSDNQLYVEDRQDTIKDSRPQIAAPDPPSPTEREGSDEAAIMFDKVPIIKVDEARPPMIKFEEAPPPEPTLSFSNTTSASRTCSEKEDSKDEVPIIKVDEAWPPMIKVDEASPPHPTPSFSDTTSASLTCSEKEDGKDEILLSPSTHKVQEKTSLVFLPEQILKKYSSATLSDGSADCVSSLSSHEHQDLSLPLYDHTSTTTPPEDVKKAKSGKNTTSDDNIEQPSCSKFRGRTNITATDDKNALRINNIFTTSNSIAESTELQQEFAESFDSSKEARNGVQDSIVVSMGVLVNSLSSAKRTLSEWNLANAYSKEKHAEKRSTRRKNLGERFEDLKHSIEEDGFSVEEEQQRKIRERLEYLQQLVEEANALVPVPVTVKQVHVVQKGLNKKSNKMKRSTSLKAKPSPSLYLSRANPRQVSAPGPAQQGLMKRSTSLKAKPSSSVYSLRPTPCKAPTPVPVRAPAQQGPKLQKGMNKKSNKMKLSAPVTPHKVNQQCVYSPQSARNNFSSAASVRSQWTTGLKKRGPLAKEKTKDRISRQGRIPTNIVFNE